MTNAIKSILFTKEATCYHLVVVYDFAYIAEISLSKHQTNITTNVRQQSEI